jgi:hypothetical protein
MLAEKNIEERVWETLQLKRSLFAGVFDSPTAEISFVKLGRKTMLRAVKEIFAQRPKSVIDHAPAKPIALTQPQQDVQTQPALSQRLTYERPLDRVGLYQVKNRSQRPSVFSRELRTGLRPTGRTRLIWCRMSFDGLFEVSRCLPASHIDHTG